MGLEELKLREVDDGISTIVSGQVCNYEDLVNLFYRLSLGAGYSEDTVNQYITCEWNDYAAHRYEEINNNDI